MNAQYIMWFLFGTLVGFLIHMLIFKEFIRRIVDDSKDIVKLLSSIKAYIKLVMDKNEKKLR